MEITLKKDGKVTVTDRIVVSAVGKSRTITTYEAGAEGKKLTNKAVYAVTGRSLTRANITSKAKLAPAGRPRKDHRGVNLISNALPLGGSWYGEPTAISNAGGYARFRSRSQDAVIRVYDSVGNVIDTHEYAGDGVKRRL